MKPRPILPEFQHSGSWFGNCWIVMHWAVLLRKEVSRYQGWSDESWCWNRSAVYLFNWGHDGGKKWTRNVLAPHSVLGSFPFLNFIKHLTPSCCFQIYPSSHVWSDSTLRTSQKVSKEGSSRRLYFLSLSHCQQPFLWPAFPSTCSSETVLVWQSPCSDKGHLDPGHLSLNQKNRFILESDMNKFWFLGSHMETDVKSNSKARNGLLSADKGDSFSNAWLVGGRGGGALFFVG